MVEGPLECAGPGRAPFRLTPEAGCLAAKRSAWRGGGFQIAIERIFDQTMNHQAMSGLMIRHNKTAAVMLSTFNLISNTPTAGTRNGWNRYNT